MKISVQLAAGQYQLVRGEWDSEEEKTNDNIIKLLKQRYFIVEAERKEKLSNKVIKEIEADMQKAFDNN